MQGMSCKWVAVAALTTVVLSSGLRAQGDQTERLLAQAEELIEQDAREDASRLLGLAWRQASRDPGRAGTRQPALRRQIERALRRADPRALNRLKLLEKTAGELEKLALKYRDAGWLDLASEVFGQVEALDPGRATEALQAIRAARGDDPNVLLFRALDHGQQPFGPLDWQRHEGGIDSPAAPSRAALLLDRAHHGGDLDLTVEVRMPEGESRAAVAFAAHADGTEFLMLELVHRAHDTSMYLRRWRDGALENITMANAALHPSVRDGFVPIHIRTRGREVRIQVADTDAFSGFVDGSMDGQVGVFVPSNTPVPEPVTFRHLQVRKPGAIAP